MKRVATLLLTAMISSLLSLTWAQVKGHTYYAFDAQLGDNIRAEVLMEVENDGHLALGQIKYANQDEAIRLYGRRNRQDPNTIVLEEHLANGQWTGSLTLFLLNGTVKNGEWRSPDGETIHPVMVARTKSFPYNQQKTFFRPANSLGGHFINYYRQGKAFKNDRTLNIMPNGPKDATFCIEHSGETVLWGYLEGKKVAENEFLYSTYDENRLTLSFKVFEDFVDVSVVMQRGEPSSEAKAEGFYIREEGVMELVAYGFSDIFSARARLENGVPTIIVSKKRLQEEMGAFEPNGNVTPGRHEISFVQGRVIDMFLGNASMEMPMPLLCLLLENHTVQIVPLSYYYETGVLAASEPLGQLSDIEYFMSYDPTPDPEPEYDMIEEGDYAGDINLYAIDKKGVPHGFHLPDSYGDYMLNPKNSVDCDFYLMMGHDWDMNFFGPNLSDHYYGTYWLIDEQWDENYEILTYTVGFRMTRMHAADDPEAPSEPCNVEGTFKYHLVRDSQDIIITPVDGFNFLPKGKGNKLTYMDGVG